MKSFVNRKTTKQGVTDRKVQDSVVINACIAAVILIIASAAVWRQALLKCFFKTFLKLL